MVTTTTELVAAYQQSGLSQAGFAQREGLRYSTFAHWVQQARRSGKRRKTAVRFIEAKLPAAPSPAASVPLEVRLPDGTDRTHLSGPSSELVLRR